MLPRVLIILLTCCSFVQAQVLVGGMSVEEVRIERGHPESTMELGSKEILIYEDGTRLEFVDGKLVKENDQTLNLKIPEAKKTAVAEKPLLSAEEIVPKREEVTIGASVKDEGAQLNQSINAYSNPEKINDLGAGLDRDESGYALEANSSGQNRMLEIGIIFGIEVIVTLIILSIAFQISGFPNIFRQLLLLSLAVALAGAMLDSVLGIGPLSLIRSAVSFLILMVLIRQMTDVRTWATAIKIAVIARLISMIIFWFLMFIVTMLFSF